jgi:transglutaminase-like putative cysteine protease
VPNRYVSGYALSAEERRTLPHAWVAIQLPSGWQEYDPTAAAPAGRRLRVAIGRAYADVAPVSGEIGAEGRYRLVSTVDVEALESNA